MFNPFTLESKTILVTGASSGIGKAIAVATSLMGATVIATGRNGSRLQSTLSEMAPNASVINADLNNAIDIQSLVTEIPKLDGIVHCAGIGHRKPTKLLESSEIDSVLATNFKSAVLLQASIMQAKKLSKGSSVVFVASKASDFPSIGNALYSASKGALISYASCLALELAPRKIRVNCISPAMVWTDLILQDEVTIESLKEAERKYPLGRYGKPDDIANLAIYLLSDASVWMTGNNIEITGGAKEL